MNREYLSAEEDSETWEILVKCELVTSFHELIVISINCFTNNYFMTFFLLIIINVLIYLPLRLFRNVFYTVKFAVVRSERVQKQLSF